METHEHEAAADGRGGALPGADRSGSSGACGGGAPPRPAVSRRVLATDPPVIAKTKALISASGRADVASLAQGVVHWGPPRAALRAAAAATAAALRAPSSGGAALNAYGPTPGLPALRAALKRQLEDRGLGGYAPVVTPGANCAFTVALLALADEDDAVVLFRPVYFNHKMAVQMTGGGRRLLLAPLRQDLRPDLDWLEGVLSQHPPGRGGGGPGGGGGEGSGGGGGEEGGGSGAAARPPKVVVLVNPANPTGILLTAAELGRAAALTAAAGAWLVIDNTYCDFVYDGRRHHCPAGPHVVHLFSLSKAYGMMGWRVGYIALPPPGCEGTGEAGAAAEAGAAGRPEAEDLGDGGPLMSEVLKVQDSIPICAAQISQIVALAALEGDGGGGGESGCGGGGGGGESGGGGGGGGGSESGGGGGSGGGGESGGGCGGGGDCGGGGGRGSGAETRPDSNAGGGGGAEAAGADAEEARVGELFGCAYTSARAAALAAGSRGAVRAALESALGPGAVAGGEGGIYFFARLPLGFEERDEDAVRWLVAEHGVCVVPGSACGAPGWLRVAFANLPPAPCAAAAARLGAGLAALAARGPAALGGPGGVGGGGTAARVGAPEATTG
ncbi:MAG: pyridoxal phosphate-dependent transferase [Monoraphidium minutum]|nr:MAG: pyridoxal phosphate-dependent transferase [Monoraphidium minutum]